MQWTVWLRRGRAMACALAVAASLPLQAAAPANPAELAQLFRTAVDRRLEVPAADQDLYARLAEDALAAAGLAPQAAQYVLVVDRSASVQALLLYWRPAAGAWQWVGASPVSTGRPGSFDHFETPLGVFDHTLDNPDFRAEGTFNANGIRGYGLQGMRVFDFGWVDVPKGWGDRQVIQMRLQLHATDPAQLERRLGTRQSKGCIRMPSTLNRLLDQYGILDAEYERAAREGLRLWVLREDREPVVDAGRYLVIVDSGRKVRPAWSPLPR